MPTASDDPVKASVDAYSADPVGYAQRYKTHRRELPERFLSLLPAASHILDLGCGPGRDLGIFTEAGHNPIGVELNDIFVEMARQHGQVIHGDIRNINDMFSSETFHGVWAQSSFVHLSERETAQVLSVVNSLLRPHGILYTCVPTTGETGWKDEDDGRRWYTVWPNDSFTHAVTAAGFHIIDVAHASFIEVWAQKI